MEFTKAKAGRVFQEVIAQIEDAIVSGELKEGERLPPERILTEMTGTSRGTVREALRVLEQKGLIVIKTGTAGGAFVRSVSPRKVSESLALLIRTQQVPMKDLAEFREGVEGKAAGLAAKRANRKDIERLEALLKEAQELLEKGEAGWADFIEVDNRIHMAVADISRNQLYKLVLETVHDNITLYYDRLLRKEMRIMKINYQDLQAIISAIADKNTVEAQRWAEKHIKKFHRLMEEE
jgi:DNA-binding FadR family transcriptional regulator